jgi:hypothetical protein|nr:MAG TPA: hypothetical protein [Caudoviricetes sp.]
MDAVEYIRKPRAEVMDAIKFIEERRRMCKSFNSLECKGCPAFNAYELSCVVDKASKVDAKGQIAIVEKWSVAHPRKTRQDLFLEQWPEAQVEDGVLTLCPSNVSSMYRNSYGGCANYGAKCTDCCREFWSQEVE